MSNENSKAVTGEHTPGPWNADIKVCYAELRKHGVTFVVPHYPDKEAKANARHILACVNALTHVSTEELESGRLQSMVQQSDDAEKQRDKLETKVADTEHALFAENQKRQDVEQQRDQLLVALEHIADQRSMVSNGDPVVLREYARAAIAAVKGGAV